MIHPQPKPRTRVLDRVAYKFKREQEERDFRLAVWRRDGGRCRRCERIVRKTLELMPERGEVHHLRGRNVAPEDRLNVRTAVLLCHQCHRFAQAHMKVG